MVEISLFFIIPMITLIDAFKTRIISLILKLLPQNINIQHKSQHITTLEKELNTISMVHEFAKHAKLQRRINKLREEKKDQVKQNAFKLMKIRYSFVTAMYITVVASFMVLLWCYSRESVMQVPEHWLWPLSSFFDWFQYTPGSITVPCWIAISSSASKTLAKIF